MRYHHLPRDPTPTFSRSWNSSWRLPTTHDDTGQYRPATDNAAKFTRTERFLVAGEGARASTARELREGQAKVRRMLGQTLYDAERHLVQRRIDPTIPGPGYVEPDSIGDDVPGGRFSTAKRFRPSLKWMNNVRDQGWHGLAGLAKPMYHDSRYGYIKPTKTNKARAPKIPGRQPPHSYLGPGFAVPSDPRPRTVSIGKGGGRRDMQKCLRPVSNRIY